MLVKRIHDKVFILFGLGLFMMRHYYMSLLKIISSWNDPQLYGFMIRYMYFVNLLNFLIEKNVLFKSLDTDLLFVG